MVKLEEIRRGVTLEGVEATLVVTVVAVVPIADSIQLIYSLPDGAIRERLLNRSDEERLSLAISARPWAFDGDGAAFKLAVEAKRMDLAFLFDPMMAVHASNVEPLPHQIAAVYETMLPRQPLRFVLADDPGAGKTIMAGLYIQEMIMRADAHRILIVAPGSLVEQWKDELFQKFGLSFELFSRNHGSVHANPFENLDRLIVRLDQISRSEELQQRLGQAKWDLVIFDEAHKLAAHYAGQDIKKTARFLLAEQLSACTRNLLLMTATPHNGKEADFQLFMSLLDADRFYGRFRNEVHKVEVSDLMRRMVKEELVRFDGTPLFPERRAYTVNYQLSPLEDQLYQAVTHYVCEQMGKAESLDGKRRGSVGFALTSLQRRLASSPEAIYQSLKRRRQRMERKLADFQRLAKGVQAFAETLMAIPVDEDELNALEQEELEELLVDDASAARTVGELEVEIGCLEELEAQALEVVRSGQDRKWEELSRILQHDPVMRGPEHPAGNAMAEPLRLKKLIIFSEHRDTLNYLRDRIAGLIGIPEAIVTIHGGTAREERQKIQARFLHDPDVRVLVATDAAGEGVNLQKANLMVNYDLPWNPNRLEQRFGRIHRIGQTEVCHLWNLVAKETREGAVYHRLLEKLEVESGALKGKVFDILGQVFEETSLRDLLIEAIKYGELPETRARLRQAVEHAMDLNHIQSILERSALAQEAMTSERLFAVRAEMEKAEARRLQPYFVRAFFLQAFGHLQGTIRTREAERYEITHVPQLIRDRDRQIAGRNHRDTTPVLKRYERVCFMREAVNPADRPGAAMAALLHPGHPLVLSVTDLILEQSGNLLKQGAVLVDPGSSSVDPYLLLLLTHEIRSGTGQVLSKRLQFVRLSPSGQVEAAGPAPHLDLAPLAEADRPLLKGLLEEEWLSGDIGHRATALAAARLAPEHYAEVSRRTTAHIDKVLAAVHDRLTKEINFWNDRYQKLEEDGRAGKDVKLPQENARRLLREMQGRLSNRKKELSAMRHIISATPVVWCGALVIPATWLEQQRQQHRSGAVPPSIFASDAEARKRVEMLAMRVVQEREERRGWRVEDVSAQRDGWDLISYPPPGSAALPRYLEVKGRAAGADTVTVTRNEIMAALNKPDQFMLAVVLVEEDGSTVGPFYVRQPFEKEPEWLVTSINYNLKVLLQRAQME